MALGGNRAWYDTMCVVISSFAIVIVVELMKSMLLPCLHSQNREN